MHCNRGRSFIVAVTVSSSCWFLCSFAQTAPKSLVSSIVAHVEVVSSSNFWVSSRRSAMVAEKAYSSAILVLHSLGGFTHALASSSAMRALYSSSIFTTFSSNSLARPVIELTFWSISASTSMLYAGISTQMSTTPFLILSSSASFSSNYVEIVLYFCLSCTLSFMSFLFCTYVLSSHSLSSSWTCIWTICKVSVGIRARSTLMNPACSTWILSGSLTLLGRIWIMRVSPYAVESP